MKRKAAFLSLIAAIILSLPVVMPMFASNGKWTYLAPENYQIVAMPKNVPVVYNALQDKDMQKISEAKSGMFIENGVEVFDNTPTDINYDKAGRPDIVPPLRFKGITPENNLVDAQKEVFEISYQDGEETEKVKIAKLTLGNQTIFTPAEPEYSPCGFIPSPDYSRFVLATQKGLWLLEAGKPSANKISKDEFNGRTYNELRSELQEKLAGIEGPATLWWNDNPIFSPDNSKIVYTTNRDCIESGGNSIWLYDLATGKEQPITRDADGAHHRCEGWVDNEYIIYMKSTKGVNQYYITKINDKSKELKLEGETPDILSMYGNIIAYTTDVFNQRNLRVVKIDPENSSSDINFIYEKQFEGVLRQIMPHAFSPTGRNFSPDGSKLAYLYAPDSNETIMHIAIIDLNTKEVTILKEAPSKDGIRTVFHDFDWLDNQRLLVRVSRVVDGLNEISSWIYSEGNSSQ